MDHIEQKKADQLPQLPSLVQRVGVVGVIKIIATVGVFLGMTLFYTMIPLAGLQLLPFLFFGCVCLVVGVADDLGAY
jgi:hypothetical protein